MRQARVLLPARLPCQFQPVPYAVGAVLVLAAGLVAPAPVARADPSGPWWTNDNGAIMKGRAKRDILLRHFTLAEGAHIPGGAARNDVFNENARRHRSADRSCAGYSQSPL